MASKRISTNTFGVAKWVVSPDPTQGTHTTIQAAINDAVSGDTIFVRDGTYVENITGKAGIALTALPANGLINPDITIQGNLTFNETGVMIVGGLSFYSNGGSVITMDGTNVSTLTFNECFLNLTSNNGIVITNDNATLDVRYSNVSCSNGNIPVSMTAGFLASFWSNWGVSDTACSITGTGRFELGFSQIQCPVQTADTAQLYVYKTQWGLSGAFNQKWIIAGATGGLNRADHCSFYSGTATAITVDGTYGLFDCVIDSANASAIDGSGTLTYGNLQFSNTSSSVSTTTQTPRSTNTTYFSGNLIGHITVPGAYPYNILATDYFISVDTSSARTVRLPNSTYTGQMFVIKDAVGSAAANNITLTTVSGAVNIDGAATVTMNTNYQTVRVIFNGTQYLTW